MRCLHWQYLIALGSNLGDRYAFINRAMELLAPSLGSLKAVSTFFETAPLGPATEQFANGCLILESKCTPQLMLEQLLDIEQSLGRQRNQHWGNRCIDLDLILAYNPQNMAVIINEPQLKIPHPHYQERDFVLQPANEIAPTWVDPLQKKTISHIFKSYQGTRYVGTPLSWSFTIS